MTARRPSWVAMKFARAASFMWRYRTSARTAPVPALLARRSRLLLQPLYSSTISTRSPSSANATHPLESAQAGNGDLTTTRFKFLPNGWRGLYPARLLRLAPSGKRMSDRNNLLQRPQTSAASQIAHRCPLRKLDSGSYAINFTDDTAQFVRCWHRSLIGQV